VSSALLDWSASFILGHFISLSSFRWNAYTDADCKQGIQQVSDAKSIVIGDADCVSYVLSIRFPVLLAVTIPEPVKLTVRIQHR
jgi:hypothetical protein